MHENLITGHEYKYQVKARNFMGFGAYSAEFTFTPRSVPPKPSAAPRNDALQTIRTQIFIEFDHLLNDGGEPITDYNIYIDDGSDGEFTGPYANGDTLTTWETSSLPDTITLTTGSIYKLKYSATNVHGEGPLSDEVSILMAEIPAAPEAFTRIDMESLQAGEIRVTWALPADEGGDPVTGYKLYLNSIIFYDASRQATFNGFTFTNLSVGQTYTIGVTAVNDIGEGEAAELDLLAASVPSKLQAPTYVSSSGDSVEISAQAPSFDGGDAVTTFVFRRDDGPLTEWEAQETDAGNTFDFTGLSASVFYRFQVAAINSIGQGAWSEHIGYFATEAPGEVQNFAVVSQNQEAISLSWEAPATDGGCAIEGYRIYIEEVAHPGYRLVYNGLRSPQISTVSLTQPTIKPSLYYKVLILAKNCGLFNSGVTLTAQSASIPSTPPAAPQVVSYDSAEELTVDWQSPIFDGGFSVTSYKLYVDNVEEVELDPSINWYQLSGLELGTTYKLQVTALNEIGESLLSASNSVVFANVPDAPDSLTLTASINPNMIQIDWTAPTNMNGDSVKGYLIYLDNGKGGPFELIFDGTGYPSVFSFMAGSEKELECGLLYNIRATAVNSAGEGIYITDQVWLGVVPSHPRSPRWVTMTPESKLTFAWD